MKKALIILPLICLFLACKNKKDVVKTVQEKPEAIKTDNTPKKVIDNSENSLDWTGTYTGQLPCADCDGIETTLTLSEDFTYALTERYLGKSNEPTILNGKFLWGEKGDRITLFSKTGNTIYKVKENTLLPLGHNEEEMSGEIAKQFMLYKSNSQLVGKYWKVVEINGQPVKMDENMKQPHLKFTANNQFTGTGGCNSMFGTYTQVNKRMVSFSGIGMTKMACAFDNYDQELLDALGIPAEIVMVGEDEVRFQVGKRMPHLKLKAEYF